ncbi:hypothetical protein EXIGLDRAFT_716524 [Exidia glandulosa HHB12029]|uniref:F-box domain-containing protein n=1 Tax=Exidia glandulosa HHB12029 TaxID=1314781 RepID=A0A165PAF3_EXIGL|nr:hypothetical protein EXIGLDRAFT_716524 [Exidia glandulosa HHB12029]
MNQNRVATPLEAHSIRAFLATVTAARERQIAEAEIQAGRTARDVAISEVRLAEAQEALERATRGLEQAVAVNAQALDFLKIAKRPLTDDPHIRCQLGLIHPVRRLPPEILAMIFHTTAWIVFEDREWALSPRLRTVSTQQTPYRLALVCRRWREIALNTPSMWRYICVDLRAITRENALLHEFYLETSFVRSAKRHVVLRVDKSLDWEGDYDRQPFRPESLRPYIVNMTRNDGVVDLSVNALDDDLFDPDSPCVNLRKLDTDVNTPVGLIHDLPTLAPHLKSISVALRTFSRRPPVTYPSVESFTLKSLFGGRSAPGHAHPYENLFGFFPNAREITLDLSTGFGTADHLRHDNVRTLRIDSWGQIERIADRYSFPRLERLEIGVKLSLWNDEDIHIEPMLHVVANGCASLRTLQIHRGIPLNADFALLLLSTPRLESLLCPRSTPDDKFLQTLGRAGADGTWMCPRLTTIQMRLGRTNEDAIVHKILDAVSTRNNAHRRGEPVVELTDVDVPGLRVGSKRQSY